MLNTELPKARVKSNLAGQATTNKKDIIFPFLLSFASPISVGVVLFCSFFSPGVSIRFCSFEGANENVWHVLVSILSKQK